MMEKDGGPAFPIPQIDNGPGNIKERHKSGMSLRDWFAGQALPACIAKSFATAGASENIVETIDRAVYWADMAAYRMLAERAKSQSGE